MSVEKAAVASAEKRATVPAGVQARAFDALFRRALGTEHALLESLRACGYDPTEPEPSYPSAIWVNCLEVARQHLFSGVSFEEGMRSLGRLFADGFASTLIGQVYQGISYTGRAYVAKLPELLRLARPDLEVQLRFESDCRCQLLVRGVDTTPPFFAGLVEARVRQRGLPALAEITRADAFGYDLLVTW